MIGGYYLVKALFPILNLVFPGITLSQLGRAMINAAHFGAPKGVLEVPDIVQLAARA